MKPTDSTVRPVDRSIPAAGIRCSRTVRPLLFALALALLAVLPLAAQLNDSPIDLSKRAKIQIKSANPDVAASQDGQYVVAAWSRGYNGQATTKSFGRVVIKSATSAGWENQVDVYSPADEESPWGYQPQLAFDPSDSGAVYVTWVECSNQTSGCDRVMVASCTLTDTDACGEPQVIFDDDETSSELRSPDIAADANGQLHLIWKKQGPQTSSERGIWYQRLGATSAAKVTATDVDSLNPSLAWSSGDGGRLHLTWYQKSDTATNRRIKYSADTNLTDDTWGSLNVDDWDLAYSVSSTSMPDLKPTIAASSTLVTVGWDVAKDSSGNFVLAYDWSSDNGSSWEDSNGGSATDCGFNGDGCGIPQTANFGANPTYNSPWTSIADEDALRPSIAINGAAPAVAWHFKGIPPGGENPVYLIGYRDSNGGTLTWNGGLTVTDYIDYDPNDGHSNDDSANPKLALWPGGETHLVHMGMWGGVPSDPNSDWDVYYRGVVSVDLSTDDVGGTYLPMIVK